MLILNLKTNFPCSTNSIIKACSFSLNVLNFIVPVFGNYLQLLIQRAPENVLYFINFKIRFLKYNFFFLTLFPYNFNTKV